MQRKTQDFLLNINKHLYNKRFLKLESNKNSNSYLPNKYIINKENINTNNENNQNLYKYPQKIKIIHFNSETEDINKENIYKYYDSNKIINIPFNEISKNKYKKKYKTINNQKRNKKYIIKNNKKNSNFDYYEKIDNEKNKKYLESNNKKFNIFIDSNKINLFTKSSNDDISFIDEKDLLVHKYNENGHKSKGKYIIKNNINYNNIKNSLITPSSMSPKLNFDYRRISNLLINNNNTENNTINRTNNNLFRKKKICKDANNFIIKNVFTPLVSKKIKEKKIFFKNYSFNNNKKLIKNDDNTDDIPIDNQNKENISNNNISSISLKNNDLNITDKNNNLFFNRESSNSYNNNNNYYLYNTNFKPSFNTTEKKKYSLTNQCSSSNIYNNSKPNNSNTIVVTNCRRNKNKNYNNRINFDTNAIIKKYLSDNNIINTNENIELNNDNNKNNMRKHGITIKEKRKIFKKKNNSFNHFNFTYNNNQSKIKKIINANDLDDDISNNNTINKNNIRFIKKLKEEKKQMISDYCSSYIRENKIKRKNLCFNNYDNKRYNIQKNNNNKINIKKHCIQNGEETKNNFNDDNKIYAIINKYKNKSALNSKHLKNKKMKNMIFTHESLFKEHKLFFQSKTNENKNIEDDNKDNKDDIHYTLNKSKKNKKKYLSPNIMKNKNSVNSIVNTSKNKNKKNDFNSNYKEEENTYKKYIDKRNLLFNINMTQSKSILNNIKYENNNNNNYNFKKVKPLIRNMYSSNIEKKIKEKILNEKKAELINWNLNTDKISNNNQKVIKNEINYGENSKNNESLKDNINIFNKEIFSYDEFSETNKEYIESNSNTNMNKEYFKEIIKKPIIINSQSCVYDNYNYDYNNYNNTKRRIFKRNNDFFNHKTVNYSKRNKIKNKEQQNEKKELKKKSCSKKENNDKNEDKKTIDSDNMLLITNITKCPKCHCLFGKSSKLLQHKKHNS